MNSPDQKALKLTGSQDLLSHFNLLPIYDRFVRPYPPPDRAAGLESSLFPYLSNLPGKKKHSSIAFSFWIEF
jgi:hypothetical protein